METVISEETSAIKKFVSRHKVAIAVTTTAAICLVLNRLALAQHDDFLRERDLYDEFYAPRVSE